MTAFRLRATSANSLRLLGSLALCAAIGLGAVACKKDAESPKPGTAAAPAPGQSAETLNEIVAQIDDTKITLGDFQDRLNKQSPYIRARYTSIERKKEFLDNLIRFEVLAKEATKRGMDKDAEVVRTMKQVMIQKLMKDEFDTRVKIEDITDVELQAFYKENIAEFVKPEQVRVSAIILKDKAKAESVAKEAKSQEAAGNQDFRALVTKHTEDEASKVRGGDLRYFGADTTELPAEVVKASFTLEKAGQVVGPVATPQGYYILKQTGRRKAMEKTFDEVKRQLQNRIYRDKRTKAMEDFVKDLTAKAKVQINEDKLAKVVIDTSAQGGEDGDGMDPHGGLPGMPPLPGMPGGPGAKGNDGAAAPGGPAGMAPAGATGRPGHAH